MNQSYKIESYGEVKELPFSTGPIIEVFTTPVPEKGMKLYCSDGKRIIGGPYQVIEAREGSCVLVMNKGNSGAIHVDMIFSTMLTVI